MVTEILSTYTARDAKTRFGEVLDEALARPVGITRHDRLTAYVVSKRDYDAMLEKLQDLEDQLWLSRAESAREEGFLSDDEVRAFLAHGLRNNNASEDSKSGQEGLRKV